MLCEVSGVLGEVYRLSRENGNGIGLSVCATGGASKVSSWCLGAAGAWHETAKICEDLANRRIEHGA